MRKAAAFVLAGLVLASLASCGRKEPTEPAELAQELVDLLAKGDFVSAVSKFDANMKALMPEAELTKTWDSLTAQVGRFKKQTGTRVAKEQGCDAVYVTCEFARATMDIKVVYDASKQVSGFWVLPHTAPGAYVPPAYANPDAFAESEVVVGSGEWAVPGTLSVPKGHGPFPAVVLVHGSGANDRDETLGANKPFRDVAWGLASRGIAVLRYDKRTWAHAVRHPAALDTFTVKEETIDDALAAVSLLRKTDKIDSRRIYVLGHSLGGMLAPWIGRSDPDIVGLIVMAGTTRPLEDVIVEQHAYIYFLDGGPDDRERKELARLEQEAAIVKNADLSALRPRSLLMATPRYWLALRDYDPPAVASRLKQPMLILQGGRDYQVTMADLKGWQKSLSSRKDVEFRVYPRLNHFFIKGSGKSTPAEYDMPGHVAPRVIADIARWIERTPAASPRS